MQWPDGAMRCDDMKVVSGKAFTECLGKIDGKVQLYNKEEAEKIFKKAEKVKVVKIKTVPESESMSELTPTVKKKVSKRPAKEVNKDQMGFKF